MQIGFGDIKERREEERAYSTKIVTLREVYSAQICQRYEHLRRHLVTSCHKLQAQLSPSTVSCRGGSDIGTSSQRAIRHAE